MTVMTAMTAMRSVQGINCIVENKTDHIISIYGLLFVTKRVNYTQTSLEQQCKCVIFIVCGLVLGHFLSFFYFVMI